MGVEYRESRGVTALLLILALFIPPIPVFIRVRLHWHFWLNILLWILGWIPGNNTIDRYFHVISQMLAVLIDDLSGVIHAWYIIFAKPSRSVKAYNDGTGQPPVVVVQHVPPAQTKPPGVV